jgi:hypothetical protein
MAPDNGNGKTPTATELLTQLSQTQDNFQQHYIIGKMLALHFESDAKWRIKMSITVSGLSAVVVALGAALIQHCVG